MASGEFITIYIVIFIPQIAYKVLVSAFLFVIVEMKMLKIPYHVIVSCNPLKYKLTLVLKELSWCTFELHSIVMICYFAVNSILILRENL